MRPNLPPIKPMVLDMIEAHWRIKRAEIVKSIQDHLKENFGEYRERKTIERAVTKCIRELAFTDGLPVTWDRRGYYIARTEEELARLHGTCRNNALAWWARAYRVKKAHLPSDPVQLTMGE